MSRIKCVNCPYHRVDNDRDTKDWFNDDDEVLICPILY